jgi:hypothetical protein
MTEIICGPAPKDKKYYEPCCGTCGLTIAWLESRIKHDSTASFEDIEIHLEDIDPLMVKAAFLQLIFYFESRKTWPKKLSIAAVDVISRRASGVRYFATLKPATAQVRQEGALPIAENSEMLSTEVKKGHAA